MRALEYDRYGKHDVVRLREAPAADGEVVIGVRWAALNPKDALVRSGRFRRLSGRRFPKRLGLDFAGEVLRSRVPRVPVGARVFGFLSQWRALRGSLAEEVGVRAEEVARLPEGAPLDLAAATGLAGSTALQALRDLLRVRPGAEILVHGASGGVGTMAIQIACALGARVTTTSSERNLALCRDLGAEEALDYESLDLRGRRFDGVFDVYGNRSRRELAPAMRRDAVFVSTVPRPRRLAMEALGRLVRSKERLVVVCAAPRDLEQLGAWLADGTLKPMVDSRHALEDHAEAFGVLESRHARGKVLVQIA